MIGRLEQRKQTSLGGTRYEDRWLVVAPRRSQFRLPTAAYKQLAPELGKISHVGVDLLQTSRTSYPLITGESASSELLVLEKVRKELE